MIPLLLSVAAMAEVLFAVGNNWPPPDSTRPPRTSYTGPGLMSIPAGMASTQGASLRLGAQGNDQGIGIQAGLLGRSGWMAWGMDGWFRPWAWARTVRTSPTRRRQYQEFLYGFVSWAQWEFPLRQAQFDLPPWRLAPVVALELTDGQWYGTKDSPDADMSPSAGLRILAPEIFQISLRYAWDGELIGPWRGELACEF